MNRVIDPTFEGTKLYDYSPVSLPIECVDLCLSEEQCFYSTFDQISRICSLYTLGSTTYVSSGISTYLAVERSMRVSIVHVRF